MTRRACSLCQAPHWAKVVRHRTDPRLWAFDLDLHEEFLEEWRHPVRVILDYGSGLCRRCAGAGRRRVQGGIQ